MSPLRLLIQGIRQEMKEERAVRRHPPLTRVTKGHGRTPQPLNYGGMQGKKKAMDNAEQVSVLCPPSDNKMYICIPKLEKAMARTGWTMASGRHSPRKVRA